MGERSEQRRERKVEKQDERRRAHAAAGDESKSRFIALHSDPIAALKESGHSPIFQTSWYQSEQGPGAWVTKMSCPKCGAKPRNLLVRHWWGLSPDRPCDGSHSV